VILRHAALAQRGWTAEVLSPGETAIGHADAYPHPADVLGSLYRRPADFSPKA
jgi:hypothetical protein